MSIENILDEFFAAIEAGDGETLDRIYADDVVVWHNFSGRDQTKEEGLATLARFAEAARSKYTVLDRHVNGNKAAQRHTIEISMRDGSGSKTIPVAMFLTFRDGQITHLYEYLDSSHIVQEAIGTATEAV